jgi:hypothetical protein
MQLVQQGLVVEKQREEQEGVDGVAGETSDGVVKEELKFPTEVNATDNNDTGKFNYTAYLKRECKNCTHELRYFFGIPDFFVLWIYVKC